MRYILTLVLALGLTFCQKTTAPENDLQVDNQVTEQAAAGFEINEFAQSADEVDAMTNGAADAGLNADIPGQGMGMMKAAINEIRANASAAARALSPISGAAKMAGDSLIASGEEQMGKFSKRWALYYDSETGMARYYEVKEGEMIFHLRYDSAEVKIDLNKTLEDGSDDLVKSMSHFQYFADDFFLNRITSLIQVTDYAGNQVTGFTASEESIYNGLGKLESKRASMEINPDGSGAISEELKFSDGTSSSSMVTFKNDYTGTFSRQFRNGISVSGSFDRLEDDLHGYYDETTTFPEGHYLNMVKNYAEVTIMLPDSVLQGLLRRAVYFSSGEVDSARVDLTISVENGFKTTSMNITKFNGAYGTITVVENDFGKSMEGIWTTWDGHFIIFNGMRTTDGSASLHYEIYASHSAYENGDDPLLTADYNFYPDETGDGTLRYNGENYDVEFDGSGEATLKQMGKQKRFRLFHHIQN